MHAKTRGIARSEVRGRRRAWRSACAAAGLAFVVAACAAGSEARTDVPEPTFRRAEGTKIAYEKPVANVSDLLPPAGDGQPWVIVGSLFDPTAGASVAATWSADDGRSWERHEVEPADDGVSEVMAAGQRDADGNVLTVGWVGEGVASDAAVWQHDGEEWTRSLPDAMGGDHQQWAFAVAANEAGTLVAGGENAWGEVRPRLWFTPDGSSWQSVDGGPGGPFDASGDESVIDVTAVGGGFVAVGSTGTGSDQDGAAWFSPDGTTWSRVDAPTLGGPGRQRLESVTSTGEAVVAGGYGSDGSDQGKPFIWQSPDGEEWAEPRPLALHGDGRTAAADYSVTGLSVAGGGITAIGGNDWRPHIWWSTDGGGSWKLLANPVHGTLFADGVSLVGSATDGTARVAIGSEPSVLVLDSGRWEDATGKAFPDGGAQPFATSLAVGDGVVVAGGYRHRPPRGTSRERFGGQIWVERGGSGWEARDSELSAGQVTEVAAFKGGFVGVGTEDFGVAADRQYLGDSQPDGLLWTSPDGNEWTRLGAEPSEVTQADLEVLDEPNADQADSIIDILASQPPETEEPAGGPGVRSLDAVAPLGDGFVAVGVAYVDGDADPIVVVSPKGKGLKGENPSAGGTGTQRFYDVCVSGGAAIAVGTAGKADGTDVLVRQRAQDGTWSKVEADDSFGGPGNQEAEACAVGDEGFVIVGSDDRSGDADARIWTSEDGRSWTRVESGLLGGEGDQWASAATAVPEDEGGGWLIGGTDTAAGDGDIALWRLTADGSLSRRDRGEPELSGPGRQSVSDIVVDGGRVLIAGTDYGRAGLWESSTIDR